MNVADIILIAIIVVAVVAAMLKRISDKKKGKGCCGGCSCNCSAPQGNKNSCNQCTSQQNLSDKGVN